MVGPQLREGLQWFERQILPVIMHVPCTPPRWCQGWASSLAESSIEMGRRYNRDHQRPYRCWIRTESLDQRSMNQQARARWPAKRKRRLAHVPCFAFGKGEGLTTAKTTSSGLIMVGMTRGRGESGNGRKKVCTSEAAPPMEPRGDNTGPRTWGRESQREVVSSPKSSNNFPCAASCALSV